MLGKETSVDDGQQVRRQSKEYLKEDAQDFCWDKSVIVEVVVICSSA
jgi:hypothetical protein